MKGTHWMDAIVALALLCMALGLIWLVSCADGITTPDWVVCAPGACGVGVMAYGCYLGVIA